MAVHDLDRLAARHRAPGLELARGGQPHEPRARARARPRRSRGVSATCRTGPGRATAASPARRACARRRAPGPPGARPRRLERVVRVDVHDPEGEDPCHVLSRPGHADVHGDPGLARPEALQRVHPHGDQGGEVRPRDAGRLGDAAVLLGHREHLEPLARRLLPRPCDRVAGFPRQQSPVDLRRPRELLLVHEKPRPPQANLPVARRVGLQHRDRAFGRRLAPRAASASARRTPATSGAASSAPAYSRTAASASPRSIAAWASPIRRSVAWSLSAVSRARTSGVVRRGRLGPTVEAHRTVDVAAARRRRSPRPRGPPRRPADPRGPRRTPRLPLPAAPRAAVRTPGPSAPARGPAGASAASRIGARPTPCLRRARPATPHEGPSASSTDTSPAAPAAKT